MNEKKRLKEKEEILNFLLATLMDACRIDVELMKNNNKQKNIFLKFNIHSVTSFVYKYIEDRELGLPEPYKPGNETEVLKTYMTHAEKILSPLYATEVQKLLAEAIEDKKPKDDFYS